MRFGFAYVEAALAGQGRRVVVIRGGETAPQEVLLRQAVINACGEEGSGAGLTASVKPASLKQESAMSHSGMD